MRTFFENALILKKYWENESIDRGYINEEQIRFISETLDLNNLSKLELNNLYSYIGLFFSNHLLSMRLNEEHNLNKYELLNDCCSATKSVIYEYINKLYK